MHSHQRHDWCTWAVILPSTNLAHWRLSSVNRQILITLGNTIHEGPVKKKTCKKKKKQRKTRALGEHRPPPQELNSWTFKPTIRTFKTYHCFFPPLFHIFANGDPSIFFMDPDSDPDHSQNLIAWSLSHLGHILKISSKSVHNFLSYLSLKITFHGSRRSRWSGSLPKLNHFFLLPFQTYPENFIKIHP